MKNLVIKFCILFLITSCSNSLQEKSFKENKNDSINKKRLPILQYVPINYICTIVLNYCKKLSGWIAFY